MDETHNHSEPTALELLAEYLGRPWVLVSTLGIVTLVLYSGTLFFEFVWDDWPQIVNNPIIRAWSNLPRAFSSDLWYHVARHQVYYRPLFVAWSMLNFTLFGLRSWGWHLGAIVLHVGAVASVFWLARKLGLEYWTAALAALIFALHPIHIETVAWISAASDTMVAMFAALAFVAFLNGRDSAGKKRRAWWIASLALLMCALLTKEMAVAFTALVAIYAWLHPAAEKASRGRRLRGAVIEAIPYAAVTLGYVLLRQHALLHSTGQFDTGHGMMDVVRTLPLVLALYLRQLLVPVGLTGLYYTPYVTGAILKPVVVPAVVLGLVLVVLWYWNRREKDSTVAFAGLWLLVGLAPALYLRNFGNGDFVRDRYIYLPSIGFAILAAKGLQLLPSIKGWSAKRVQVGATVALCSFYVVASLSQQVYWDSYFLVLLRGQKLYPGNPYTAVGLAAEYSQRGAYDRAIELAEWAVREHPEYGYSAMALAETYIRAGRFDAGRVMLQKALLISPDYAKSETGMASVAGLYGRMGDFGKALALCDQILAKEPDLYSALYNCGNIHLMAGQYAEAERLLSHAIEGAPEAAGPKHYLGRALLQEGKNREAQAYLAAAAAIDPKVWDYHYWLGESLEQSGHIPAARAQYQEVLRLNPDSTEAKMRLAATEGK
ncbi:MAG: tetratricopeptide repeat protein [Acidobacteriia bacterium]|nr:tetratricopeptide repeat protein [Terriglobia bacterium]